MVRAAVHRKKPPRNEDAKRAEEERIGQAIEWLHEDPTRTIAAAKREFLVNYYNLHNRYLNHHQPQRRAHEHQQLLTHAEEQVLVDWMDHRSATGRPLSKRSLKYKLEKVIGFRPGKRWITKFLARHPTIRLGKPSGLDPLRAQCFNKANIDQHFDELEEVLEKKGIPWCNVYNMDEKGCQRGGGRRMQSIKFFIPRTRRPHYKLRSGNLQLTTIIECICADGTELPPGFVFPGKQFHEEWFSDLPEGIR